jgi:hypothetical protein
MAFFFFSLLMWCVTLPVFFFNLFFSFIIVYVHTRLGSFLLPALHCLFFLNQPFFFFNQPFISGINLTWLWYIFLFIYYQICLSIFC